ncbi:MAG: lysylphosphatidylglycerol synthase domain-containing protein, partial [Polyangiaceae bacterium]
CALPIFALWLILLGFGQELPLALAIFFYSTATLAGALIPLPGGLGVTDGLIEEQLVHLGHVGTGIATGAMLLVRFATLWFAVLVGFLALAGLRHYHPDFKIGANDVRGDGD